MGRCSAQLQNRTVLLHTWRQEWLLDEEAQWIQPGAHSIQHSVQKVLLHQTPIWLVSLIWDILWTYGPRPSRHPRYISMCWWREGPGFNWGKAYDLHLLETVDRARAAGIKFNPDKCQIKKRKMTYFGRVISPSGVEPCPKKVQAILRLALDSSSIVRAWRRSEVLLLLRSSNGWRRRDGALSLKVISIPRDTLLIISGNSGTSSDHLAW